MLGQARNTQRRQARVRDDEPQLVKRIVWMASEYGRSFRMLTIVDEFTRECPAIDVSRKLTSEDVLERLSDLFVRRGVPDHIRSDNLRLSKRTGASHWH